MAHEQLLLKIITHLKLYRNYSQTVHLAVGIYYKLKQAKNLLIIINGACVMLGKAA